jgi:hypothetical protein
MGKRWVQIGRDGEPLARSEKKAKSYSRAEVESLIKKELRAHGIDPATVSEPKLGRITPKTVDEIEKDRSSRQAMLERDLRKQASTRRASGRTATVFEQSDGSTVDVGGDGSVTRLDLSQPVKRSRRGLFGEIIDARAAEPYTYRCRRNGR